MKTYLCSYHIDGTQWQIEFQAESFDDAERRLRAIKRNGCVDGELMATIPVPSFMERVLTWWHSR